jgi:hypothetical protein
LRGGNSWFLGSRFLREPIKRRRSWRGHRQFEVRRRGCRGRWCRRGGTRYCSAARPAGSADPPGSIAMSRRGGTVCPRGRGQRRDGKWFQADGTALRRRTRAWRRKSGVAVRTLIRRGHDVTSWYGTCPSARHEGPSLSTHRRSNSLARERSNSSSIVPPAQREGYENPGAFQMGFPLLTPHASFRFKNHHVNAISTANCTSSISHGSTRSFS